MFLLSLTPHTRLFPQSTHINLRVRKGGPAPGCLWFVIYTVGMTNKYTAVVKEDGGWWIGWIEEVPGVNCQGATRAELLESLRVTLGEALAFNREDALI